MRALIVVDLQNDFCAGGALAVPDGDAAVEVANRLMEKFKLVVATQDWHPADHGSFAANHPERKPGEVITLNGLAQVLWPVHCVQGSQGAAFHPALRRAGITKVFRKGTDPGVDSYSAFFDNGGRGSTGLGEYLKEKGVTEVYITGLATDYCVKYSALDAVKLGFRTRVVEDGCRGVELAEGDVECALAMMKEAGVEMVRSEAVGAEEETRHEEIRFHGARGEFGFLSNFAAYPIVVGGKEWPTSEHYFQAQKFAGTQQEERIRTTRSPMIAARLGRTRKVAMRGDWEEVKEAVMLETLRAKFTQDTGLREALLATGAARLVEESKKDRYWGQGSDGTGKNRLGELLMRVREEMRHAT